MTFVKWWINDLVIPGLCILLSAWGIAVLLTLLNNAYTLISNVTYIN